MPIELRSFEDLDPNVVAQQLTETVQRVQEDNPHIDMRMGVFFSLLGYYHALLATQQQTNIADYLNGRSLLMIEADPALALPDLVDDVFSNFRVERKLGSRATGSLTIILSREINTVIGVGSVFEATGGIRFVTEDVFTAKLADDHVLSATDRPLTRTADGNYAFVIEVVAEVEGATGEIKKDTVVAPLVEPNFFVTSYAANDFTGGKDAETNTELLNKLQLGLAGKAMSNRTQMQAMLRDIDAFSRVIAMSIIGYGDQEMLRDQHTIFPMSFGGRVDWYVRGQEQIYRLKITKEAVLIGTDALGRGIWQMAISRTDAPGFYELANVRLANAEEVVGGFNILTDTRGVDVTGDDFVPDIDVTNIAESAYSAYQTAIIRFVDTVTPTNTLSVGARQSYDLEARCMPLIGEIQTHVNDRAVRHHGSDCLVKAPVPCFTTINFTIYKQSGEATPDLDAIKNAICTEINNIGFIGRLYASRLHDTIHGYLRNATSLSAIDMHGRIRYPDGSIKYVRGSEVLRVPDAPSAMVSPRTVQFFISPEDIGISVETTVPANS